MNEQRLHLDGVDRRPVHNPYDDTQIGTFAVAATMTAAVEQAPITGIPAHRRAMASRPVGFAAAVDQCPLEAA